MEKTIQSLEETQALGLLLAKHVFPGCLITLQGDLGAGKTTFTKSIGKGIGVNKTINSPTFTIMKAYTGSMPLYHIDAYRLEGISQDLGFEEYIEGDGVCVIEWPQYIKDQIPSEHLAIEIRRIDEEKRLFIFQATGQKYEKILEELM